MAYGGVSFFGIGVVAARSLSGFEGALPDNYGWDCARLAAHLESWKARWAEAPPATEPA